MVTVIHVVDTLEPTQSLPPVAAIPLSVSLSAASLRACQGHGAVSYYKRRSPSLLQETQTHQSRVPPTPTPLLLHHHHHHFNYTLSLWPFCAEEAWETHSHTDKQSGQTRDSKTLNFSTVFPEVLVFMFICWQPRQREHSALHIYHSFRVKWAFHIQTGSWEKSFSSLLSVRSSEIFSTHFFKEVCLLFLPAQPLKVLT